MRTEQEVIDFAALIPGWCTNEKSWTIYELTYKEKLKKGLEIGVYHGKSLFVSALAMRDSGARGVILGVDPWLHYEQFEADGEPIAIANDMSKQLSWDNLYLDTKKLKDTLTSQYGVGFYCQLKRMSSQEFSENEPGHRFDYIHIDGNHSFESTNLDLHLHLKNLDSGGFLVMDDINWSGVQKALGNYSTQLREHYVASDGKWGIFQKL